jgi:periplasmic protein TonB
MSEVIAIHEFGEFDALLQHVLRDRVTATAPGGLEQRLLARLAQEETARPFAFAERVATRRSAASLWVAVGAHAAAILVIFTVVSQHLQTARAKVKVLATLTVSPPLVAPKLVGIGGGGGQHDLAPVTQGHLPKLAPQQLLPPKAPPTVAPKLAIEPSVVVQPDLKMATNTMPNIGAPTSSLKGFSMGNGTGTGIGSGVGNGVGLGSGGNTGGGVMRVGGSVHAPLLIHEVDPQFSEEARKAKFSGNVLVSLIVDEQGNPSHVRVARGVGMGLDEKALEAVREYRFKPAMQNGKPVKVEMNVEVNFQIF